VKDVAFAHVDIVHGLGRPSGRADRGSKGAAGVDAFQEAEAGVGKELGLVPGSVVQLAESKDKDTKFE
jgi:hypothetical protein